MQPEAKRNFYPNLIFGGEAHNLAVIADLETKDIYEENLEYYEERNYQYIPMPDDGVYYDRENEVFEKLSEDQFIAADATIKEVFQRLEDLPFLLIDRATRLDLYVVSSEEFYLTENTAPDNAIKADADLIEADYPSIAESIPVLGEDRYQIITLADLNRRAVGEELYPIIAELETQLAQLVRNDVPDSLDLYSQLPPHVIGRREKDKLQNIETHVVEYLGLTELMKVIKGRPHLCEEAGFSSPSDCDDRLGSINRIRNRVMHANRTLIQNREDVTKTLERVDDAQNLIAKLHDVPIEHVQGRFDEVLKEALD